MDVNINQQEPISGKTALIRAAESGDVEKIKELLNRKGIDVNLSDAIGQTALMYAAKNGQAKPIDALRRLRGINVNLFNNYEQTAYMLAAKYKSKEAIEALEKFNGIITGIGRIDPYGSCILEIGNIVSTDGTPQLPWTK